MGRKGLISSFKYAFSGIACAFVSGRNIKIHGLAALVVVVAGLWVQVKPLEWAILSLTIFMVLAAETTNTAIEKTVDLVTAEYHPLARQAKNLAAGAVLLTAINSIIIAVIIFKPYLFR
jgi:diacylglycerol kinase